MSDRATIDIDCERGLVSIALDTFHHVRIDRQIQTTRAALITDLLRPVIAELMCAGSDDLESRVKSLRALESGLVTKT